MSNSKSTIWSRNFICALIANSLLALSHNSVNTLVADYASLSLGAGAKLMGLLTGMFFGVALAMRPVAGPLSTKVDKRKLMIIAYALGCFVNLGYALFHSIGAFVFFRVLNGIEYAFVGSLAMSIVGDSLPNDKMASGIGVFGVGSAIATSIGPSCGIWMRNIGGYTFVFLFAALALALALIPAFLLEPDKKDKELIAQTGKWYANIVSKHTICPALVMMLLIISYSLYNSYCVPFGEENGIEGIGIFFTVISLVMLVTRPVSGRLTDKLGLSKILIPGVLIFSSSFLIVSSATNLTLIVIGAVVAAIGYGTVNPAVQSMCLTCETPAKRAVASNTLYIGMDIGFFVGPVIGGFVKAYAPFKTVIRCGFIPAILGILLFLCCIKPYNERQKILNENT